MTTKRWAVGHADFSDNDLVIEIVEAENVRSAILAHSVVAKGADNTGEVPHDLEGIKQFFFDMDTLVSATEIP